MSDAFFVMKIANAALSQFSRQALGARNHRLSKCYGDASGAKNLYLCFRLWRGGLVHALRGISLIANARIVSPFGEEV